MKNLDELHRLYLEAKDRAERSMADVDPHMIGLLAVYDEGWTEGYKRAEFDRAEAVKRLFTYPTVFGDD